MVRVDPAVKMKEELVEIGGEKFWVFLAVGDSVEAVMRLVVMHDGEKGVVEA